MRKIFLSSSFLPILLIAIVLITGCRLSVKPEIGFEKPDIKPPDTTGSVIPSKSKDLQVEQIVINPNPCSPEKAVSVMVRAKGKISKVLIKVKGAESYLGEGIYLRPAGDNEWVIGFIAPQPGYYPLETVLFDYQGNNIPFTSPDWILRVEGSKNNASNPEELIRKYFLNLVFEQPKVFKSIEVLDIEEISIPHEKRLDPKNTRLFRVEVQKEYWDSEFSKQNKNKTSSYYIYLSRNNPSATWYISEVSTSP